MLDDKDIKKLKEVLATKTDIEDLAIMVGKGFDAVDKNFEKINKRFDKMDEVADLKKRMSRLEEALAIK